MRPQKNKGVLLSKNFKKNLTATKMATKEVQPTNTAGILRLLQTKIGTKSTNSRIEIDCPCKDYLHDILKIIEYDCKDALNEEYFKKSFLELRKDA